MAKKDISKEEGDKIDVIVIGAGPAGMMAAIQAARKGLRVVLLEKNSQPGKKLLLTGNGRCNLCNAEYNLRQLVENYHNGEFLFRAFSVFGPARTIEFFNNLGISTKTEKDYSGRLKRVFPARENAADVIMALKKELEKNKVKIIFGAEVLKISVKANKIQKIILADKTELIAKNYIFCTGGKSYPLTGSDGSAYNLIAKLGHTIITLSPALCPLRLKEEWVKSLQGITLENIRVNVFQAGGKKAFEDGPIIFTHYGVSGPAILNLSGFIAELLKNGEVKIGIDLFPKLNQEEVLKGLEEILQKYPRQTVKNVLTELAPLKFIEVFLQIVKVDPAKIANNLPKKEKAFLAKNLKNFEATVEDVYGFDLAMVTRGGVTLKEIDHKTMRSKIIKNLFFAGEVIDADGKTGGFNLQLCWSTGFLAGNSVSS